MRVKANWTNVPGAKVSVKKLRKPMRRVSAKRIQDYLVWKRVEREVLVEHPYCTACPILRPDERANRSVGGHHLRGRTGSLYTDKRFILAVCQECHDEIHFDRGRAIQLGLLAGKGQWGQPGPAIQAA